MSLRDCHPDFEALGSFTEAHPVVDSVARSSLDDFNDMPLVLARHQVLQTELKDDVFGFISLLCTDVSNCC